MAAANPMGGAVMGAGMPSGLGGGGGGLGSGFSIPGLDNLSGLTRTHHHDPNQMLDARDAAISGGSPLAQIAVKAALTKLGKPYVWGAKGPNEFDCSGLTHWAYAQAGITLGPHGSPLGRRQVSESLGIDGGTSSRCSGARDEVSQQLRLRQSSRLCRPHLP
jgi:hypothetical protein